MAAPTQTPTISIEEYMRTIYHPDREYIDGELRERNVGKWEHSRIQYWLAAWFGNHEAAWNMRGSTEQRSHVARPRVRIPDLVLVKAKKQPDVLVNPPVLIVEILSPDDSYSEMRERVGDYQTMGVGTVWIIDPKTRTGQVCAGDTWTAARTLTVPKTPIYVELDTLFSYLDRPADPA